MRKSYSLSLLAATLLAGVALSSAAEARGFVSVGIGVGAPYYGYSYGYAPTYAYPYPYYYPAYPVAAYPVPAYPPTAYPAYAPAPTAPATAQNTNCREYTHTVTINGQQQPVQGEACQQPDGKWKIIN